MANATNAVAVNEGLLFQRLRWRLWRNSMRALLHRGQIRALTILLCSLLVWGSLFALSFIGFHELKMRWNFPLDGEILGLVFDWMFTALMALLVFSTAIILYASLFTSAETGFLLSTPARTDQIFAYKFQGAVAFSSWAFVLLASPILIAYGLNVGSPLYFYAILPLYFLGFVLIPGSIGAFLAVLLVNYVPRHWKQVLGVVIAVLFGGGAWWGYTWASAGSDLFSRDALNQLLGEIVFVRSRFMPAHWVAQGLQAAALGELGSMTYFLALVWSNGLFFYVITAWTAGKLYRRGFNRVVTGGTLRKRYGGGWLDRALDRLIFFAQPQTRLLILKDFRTFRRDPAQWAQILIFIGLAVLYFSNVRRFYQSDLGLSFQNGISLLNLTATSFLMCAYNGRFVFPMLSLEGRKFWILGLLPLQRDRLLVGKFGFAATGCLLVGEFLMAFSNAMLVTPWQIMVVHAVTIAVLALGLSGLSVGLGACLPNFRETDPSKIAVGFGGTLNLEAGLLFLVVVIAVMAGPWHAVLAVQGDFYRVPWWLWGALAAGALIGWAGAILPLRAGARALRSMEF